MSEMLYQSRKFLGEHFIHFDFIFCLNFIDIVSFPRIANSPKKITVDIVAEGGSLWIKVIAKSAK